MKKSLRVLSLVLCFVLFAIGVGAASSHTYYTNQPTMNFTTTNLSKLTNNVGSATYNWYDRIYSKGCMVTCVAMVLNNLDVSTTSSKTDIRTGRTGYLDADPFTVTYANTGFASITKNASGNYVSSYTKDPVTLVVNNINDGFGVTMHSVDIAKYDSGYKLYEITKLSKEHPEGIIVYFKSGSKSHGVVVMESTASLDYGRSITPFTAQQIQYYEANRPIAKICTHADIIEPSTTVIDPQRKQFDGFNETDKIYGEYLTVCDPINYNSYLGDYVCMNDAYIGKDASMHFSDITKIYYFTK